MTTMSRGAGKDVSCSGLVGGAQFGGGRGQGGGPGQGGGRGMRRRLRDGSGAGSSATATSPETAQPALRNAGETGAPATDAQASVVRASFVARLDDPNLCIGCGICVDACPQSAIKLDDVASIDRELCTGCNACVDACPRGILSLVQA